ncbi:MAG: hypothetical protein JNM10_10980 [Planctomycetia bacterium]|nr:hypothetical protein [Planctomycetia bacterium]
MIQRVFRWSSAAALVVAAAALSGCGGGGSDPVATDWAIVSLNGVGTTGQQTLMGGERVFTYDYDEPSAEPESAWEIARVAGSDGSVLIDWTLDGFHGFFLDWVTIEFFVQRHRGEDVEVLVATDPNADDGPNTIDGPFSFGGTVDVFVPAGARYGFRITGANFDSGGALQGEFTLLE